MSDYYGKAVFTDGTEAFLVYRTSPGWVLKPLFSTLEAVMAWKEAGCPELNREHYKAVSRSLANEEPVHVLIDIESPDRPSMWFYSTASKADMVITGPNSELQAEESNEQAGGIYTKEFFDSWEPEKPASQMLTVRRSQHESDSGLDR